MDYNQFLASKLSPSSFPGLNRTAEAPHLFHYQRDMVNWALRKGRACLFADCGLGKTPMQLEWARIVADETKNPVLILAPLAVSKQTKREGDKFGVPVTIAANQDDITQGVNITNYEKLDHFDLGSFSGVVLDESSILKSFDGKMRKRLIDGFSQTQYRLACSATPAPNDHEELGNQAEFLGVMTYNEMLAMYFINDMGESAKWRLKGHAERAFWQWIVSWGLIVQRPSDLGYSDDGFTLPQLITRANIVGSNWKPDGRLFADERMSLSERRAARNASLSERVAKCVEIVAAEPDSQFVIWCDGNEEAESVTRAISGAKNVQGKDSPEYKEQTMLDFADGRLRVLVTKPKIAGFGMNWQNCNRTILCGISDSYEAFYQLTRRFWRYGQKNDVIVDIVASDQEIPIINNVKRKESQAQKMADGVREFIKDEMQNQLKGARVNKMEYKTGIERGDNWALHLGDCVENIKKIDSDSVHFSVFSPPFASLYTYSASDRDMGNCLSADDFAKHFSFLVSELYRVIKPGRLVAFHCMNLPTTKARDGFIGITDFRGDLIRAFQSAGFIYHSEVCIWKDPVLAMQRTKALGLLHKQLKKDSCMSRQGIPDYLVAMRKPGVNGEPVTHDDTDFPVFLWQQVASPIKPDTSAEYAEWERIFNNGAWFDINPSDTLQYQSAREDQDEKHICPLQLEVIRRALKLWSNPGDLVLTPFAGIGSELYVSLEQGRRAVGFELKESYFKQAVRNCQSAEKQLTAQKTLFDNPAHGC